MGPDSGRAFFGGHAIVKDLERTVDDGLDAHGNEGVLERPGLDLATLLLEVLVGHFRSLLTHLANRFVPIARALVLDNEEAVFEVHCAAEAVHAELAGRIVGLYHELLGERSCHVHRHGLILSVGLSGEVLGVPEGAHLEERNHKRHEDARLGRHVGLGKLGLGAGRLEHLALGLEHRHRRLGTERVIALGNEITDEREIHVNCVKSVGHDDGPQT